jgi:RNA polymerase sigma factor (sigma-70 family)
MRESYASSADTVLVERCRAGDAGAWEALVHRYQRLVFSIPRRAGLDEESASDVFQHVFATLVAHIEKLEDPERIGAWLVTTTRRETWRVCRRSSLSRASTRSVDDEAAEEVPDGEPLPEEQLLRLEQQHAVLRAVESLDERCCVLLRLLFLQTTQPSYGEIAAALHTSEGSIGPMRARCLQKLRRIVTERGI